jgi:iron uptake system component EfeO
VKRLHRNPHAAIHGMWFLLTAGGEVAFNDAVNRVRGHDRRSGVEVCLFAVALTAALAACAEKTDADYRTEVTASMHSSITSDLAALVSAAHDLQTAAPSRAWNPAADTAAITRMRESWGRMRGSWEHVEGAIQLMFAGFNETLDSRYEDFLRDIGDRGDQDLFDDEGVIGMHAVERILFAPRTRPEVVAFERRLPGYKIAAYPATDNEAIAFKTQLVQRLIDDAEALASGWRPDDIDIGAAYHGLVDLMIEQQDKVDLAVTGEEESRYANVTMADLRNNLTGTNKVYELFREWIRSKASAAESSDQQVVKKLSALMDVYLLTASDSLPDVPPGWSSTDPTPEALDTPFGALWQQIRDSVDPNNSSSVVHEMTRIGTLLGFMVPAGYEPPPNIRLHTRTHHRR